MRPLSPALTLLIAGCAGGTDADTGSDSAPPGVEYRLVLEPVLAGNQLDIMSDATSVTLTLDGPAGTEVLDLTAIDQGFAARDLSELTDTTMTLEARNGAGTLVAWGQTPPLSVADGQGLDDDYVVRFLVAAPDARASAPPLSVPVAGGPLVADGQGRFLLFGGSTAGTNNSGVNTVWAFDFRSESASLSPTQVGTLPVIEEGVTGRVGHSAVLLTGDHDDQGKIFIAGGGPDYYGNTQISRQSYLWDPRTDTVEEIPRAISGGTTLHTAVEGPGGNVLLVGGFSRASSDTTFSFGKRAFRYEAQSRELSLIDNDNGLSYYDLAGAARLTALGVLVCGGIDLTSSSTFVVSEGCDLITDNGAVVPQEQAGAALHTGLYFHRLTTLADGRVLLTGGLAVEPGVEQPSSAVQTATNEAWIFDGDTWTETGSLTLPRALHATTLLPDGRVLVTGGISQNTGPLFDTASAVACAEIYDPSTETFSIVGSCTSSSSSGYTSQVAALSSLAADDRGALLVGGLGQSGAPIGDVSYYFLPEAE